MVERKVKEAKEALKDDTAPSGDIGAKDKEGKDVRKEESKKVKVQDKVEEVNKGKQKVENVLVTMEIDTPKDKGKRILPQISINFDGPLNIGQMSLAERLMVAATVQVQASQDLVKSETEDEKLIEMTAGVLQKVVMELQLDPNSNPSYNLLQLINNISTNFESLEKGTTKKVLERFKEVRMQTFQKMIEDDRVRLNKGLPYTPQIYIRYRQVDQCLSGQA